MIRWDAPGPYAVAFTTREGGVSDGPFASLNLGTKGGDTPARVAENRRLACAALGLDAARLAFNRQRHSPGVLRAEAAIGPAIGPCCYEVGPEVSGLFDRDLTREGNLDLWSASERALTGAGVASVERLDLCTRCHPEEFFSHRYSGPRRGAQGVIGAVAG